MYGFYSVLNRKCSLSVFWLNSLPVFTSSILKHLLRESLITSTENDRQWEMQFIYWSFSRIKQAILILDSGYTLCILDKEFKYLCMVYICTPNASFKNKFFGMIQAVWVFWRFSEASHNFIKSSLIFICCKMMFHSGIYQNFLCSCARRNQNEVSG